MAYSRADQRQDGYATVAAMGVSLAVALLAGALVLRGVSALKLARADFRRSQAEYALSGVQTLAAIKLLNSEGWSRLAWSLGGQDVGDIAILAEPEAAKLRLAAASALDGKALEVLGAEDGRTARERLARLDLANATPDQVAAVDPGAAWRACANSAISPWGAAQTLRLSSTEPPRQEVGGVRAGQIWRIRATTRDGWVDERIVRVIGQAQAPSVMIWRRFGRGAARVGTCDKTIGN